MSVDVRYTAVATALGGRDDRASTSDSARALRLQVNSAPGSARRCSVVHTIT
jgi:hypothetical protein